MAKPNPIPDVAAAHAALARQTQARVEAAKAARQAAEAAHHAAASGGRR